MFQVKARFPVRALIPDSKAYLYYEPDVRAEEAGEPITVGFDWPSDGMFLAGDLNKDCQVDLLDFALLASGWPDTYDLIDLAELASNWLQISCW